MYIDNFAEALKAFDDVLDRLAREQRGDCITVSSAPIKKYGNTTLKSGVHDILEDISTVIYNKPATIVVFKDGSKVCVKLSLIHI